MALLVLQHVECDGPGYLADCAAARNFKPMDERKMVAVIGLYERYA